VILVPPSTKIRFRLTTASATPIPGDPDCVEPRIVVEGDDGASESLLRYLWSGQLVSAQPLGDRVVANAEQMLEANPADVRGAAIAGYYLLRIGAYERLRDWPKDFAKRAKWLPDSAVIHAWQILRDPRLDDYHTARTRLLQAEIAGMPVYAEGLRLLYDGLRLFAEKDAEAAQAATHVARYLRAMNTRSPLTEIFGRGPASPDPLPFHDTPPFRGAVPLFPRMLG
jgi:hypothetical protein